MFQFRLGSAFAILVALLILPVVVFAGNSNGRFFVEFHKFENAANTVHAAGGTVVYEFPKHKVVAAWLPDRALKGLQNNPNIKSISEDPKRYPMAQTVPYGIPMVQADQVSDGSAGNRKVCIIDSGYYLDHEDLQNSRVSASPDSGTGDPFTDQCAHGSHVAGTIAALNNTVGVVGVLPNGNINLHIVKVFGDNCSWTYSSSLMNALDMCRSAGSNVVSMSLGGGKSRFEELAFNDAYNAGVLSIAAAGNDGSTRKSYPASYNSVVSVAAIDSNKVVADFSQKNDQVELAAPGVGVLSTVGYNDTSTLTVSSVTYAGAHIENSGRTNGVTGALANGGLCDSVGSWGGKVVLCERGTISFNEKVQNVQSGGGAAAAIYNNAPGGFSGTLGDGNSSNIAAISLSQEDGQFLVANKIGQNGTLVSSFAQPASGYALFDGTSMATPHVSGVAALVWSHNTNWTNEQVRIALQSSAEDLGAAGRDTSYGYGLVQAKAALDFLNGGSSCTPTEPSEVTCNDGLDNDCDNFIDIDDVDCQIGCAPTGASCNSNSECCSNNCKGKPGNKVCK